MNRFPINTTKVKCSIKTMPQARLAQPTRHLQSAPTVSLPVGLSSRGCHQSVGRLHQASCSVLSQHRHTSTSHTTPSRTRELPTCFWSTVINMLTTANSIQFLHINKVQTHIYIKRLFNLESDNKYSKLSTNGWIYMPGS